MTPLGALIEARIAAEGPMRLDHYMALCLGHPEHGYYTTRDPFGTKGDFVTAPEISQMFGELIGAWLAQVWLDQGAPSRFVLAELGPGRGTLMRDALRAAGGLAGFRAAADIRLVETSPTLAALQARAVPGATFARSLTELPPAPLLLVANEFFDALPIRQFQRVETLWRERRVGPGPALIWDIPRADAGLDARFPGLADGTIVEVNPAGEAMAAWLGERIAAEGGAALIVDYGAWDGTGDTLQAMRAHGFCDPTDGPGTADLTAHVRFRALAEAAAAVRTHGPVEQGPFLERLGIGARAATLARGKEAGVAKSVAEAHRRLTHPSEMGHLFKAMALSPRGAPVPPGFEA